MAAPQHLRRYRRPAAWLALGRGVPGIDLETVRIWKKPEDEAKTMKEVLSTSDPVKLSFAQAVLKEAGIDAVLLDAGTAALYGGGLSSIQPRLMVAESDAHTAKSALDAAFREARENAGGAIRRPETGLD